MMRAVMRRRAPIAFAALAAAALLASCGTQSNRVLSSPTASTDVKNGSKLFTERCAGCHTLDRVGAEGGATKVRDRERVDGPNFNVRKECVDNVLYAIRNGGYSGAIMPENIAVGKDATDIAKFLQKYSGLQRKKIPGAKLVTCPGE
jgi:mono/diheme cytochrome c family protein